HKVALVSKKIFKNLTPEELYENLVFQDTDFIRRVKEGKKEKFSGADSLKTMQVAFACEESAKKRKKVLL
ncbi:MAG: hypothetical protein WCK36_03665, partial [Candidatus Firestonebacteria bacterium]